MDNVFLAQVIIEAKTPLAVGTGDKNIMTDQPVSLDVNGLPFIPGTSLAGVIRHLLSDNLSNDEQKEIDEVFGIQTDSISGSFGSRLIFSSAHLIGHDGKVIDGLQKIDFGSAFYAQFKDLPIRQHVRISNKGAAEHRGKFDNQVVYKGARFSFELEMIAESETLSEHKQTWEKVIKSLNNPLFRLGGGTRKGYGEVGVVSIKTSELELSDASQLKRYLQKSSALNNNFWDDVQNTAANINEKSKLKHFRLELTPDDFFLFSSGFESEDADVSFLTESVIEWEKEKPTFKTKNIVIPSSSVKGAILHRVAFHYNKLAGVYADTLDKLPETSENEAVKALFGYSADGSDGKRGKVIISDLFLDNNLPKKILNHVSIDRFTGGAIAGALYSEEVIYGKDENFVLDIFVEPITIGNDSNVEESLILALKDICNGMLPLGGGTMRGHGCFNGKLFVNDQEVEL